MTPVATIFIPFSEAHKSIVENAFRSAVNQTVKCDIVMEASPKTPALLRNRAQNAKTDFVVFLDADDTLEPNFIEECLRAYEQGKYVYTSWWCDNMLVKPNLCVDETRRGDYRSHLVTTLYPTIYFKMIGGFDESLDGHEDVDFYLRSAKRGVCGLHLDKALVHYSEHGQRSKLFTNDAVKMKNTMDYIYLKNGGQRTIMGCCGGAGIQAVQNPGDECEGCVKVVAMWAGMRSEVGLATGRVYRGGNRGVLNVHVDDIAQRPDLFQPVRDLTKISPDKKSVLKTAGLT